MAPSGIHSAAHPAHLPASHPLLGGGQAGGGEAAEAQERDGVAAVPALAAAAVAAAAAAVPAVAAAVASMTENSRAALKDAADAIARDLATSASSAAAALPPQREEAGGVRGEGCGCATAAANGISALHVGVTESRDNSSGQHSGFDLGASLRAVVNAVKGWHWAGSKGKEAEKDVVQQLQHQQHTTSDLPVCIHEDIGVPYCLLAERPVDGEFHQTSIA